MTELISLCFGLMPGKRNEPICWTHKEEISDLCVCGCVAFQGRQSYMEDRFAVIKVNHDDNEISLFAVFDGHAGDFAATYGETIIMPQIANKIKQILDYIKLKNQPVEVIQADEVKEPLTADDEPKETPVAETNILEKYVTENNINYEQLLNDEIIQADKVLIERMAKAALFGGTTLILILLDLKNKIVVTANVGDSRAVMCDSKGATVPLSQDHKPNNPLEMKRIRDNGGFISHKGVWRVEGSLACSRSLGDYPLKQKNVIISTPDIVTYRYKDIRNLPKFIIIASDGCWDVLSNTDAVDYVKTKLKENHYGARSLMKKAAKQSSDNVTVIIIKFIKPPKPKKSKPSFNYGDYDWLR